MKNLLSKLGLLKKKEEMSLDEYIESIRPKSRVLSHLYTTVEVPSKKVEVKDNNDDDGPEEASCMVLA